MLCFGVWEVIYTSRISQRLNFMESSKFGNLASDTGRNGFNSLSAKAWITKARAANRNKDYEDAIKYFNKYRAVDPSNSEVIIELGGALYNIERYDDAIACYDNLINNLEIESKKSRSDQILIANALKGKGNALVAKGNYEEALRLYNKVIADAKNTKISNDALYNKAIVYYKTQNYEKADELFNEVTNKNLNDELAWRGKAAALEKLGKRDEAFKALIKSMKSAGIKLRKLGIR